VIAAEIEGRLTIHDAEGRLVVEVDKPAGRSLQMALEPGVYEARLRTQGSGRARFQVSEGRQLLIGLGSFGTPGSAAHAPQGAPSEPHHHQGPIDKRHRIELRFGGWGGYSYDGQVHDVDSARFAFGLEYLHFIRNDIGIGLAISTLSAVEGAWDDWGDWNDTGSARATCSVPIVARWYPARRLTGTRAVEPYLAAGLGPVFGADTVFTEYHGPHGWHETEWSSTRVGTTFGGRLGGGVDVRLGSVFTLGFAGAWNWDASSRPDSGEFTLVLGWNFGG
jgi:hypothetical protein